jgi:hypothetical protein
MFELLAILIGLYTMYAVFQGRVYAKSVVWGRTVSRADSPEYFWVVVAIYAGLSAALITIF